MESKNPLSEPNISSFQQQLVTDNSVKQTTLVRKPSECNSHCSKRNSKRKSERDHSEQTHDSSKASETTSGKYRIKENDPRKMKAKKSDSGNIQGSSNTSQTSLNSQNEIKNPRKMVSVRKVKRFDAEQTDGLSKASEARTKPEREEEKFVSVQKENKRYSEGLGESSKTYETTLFIPVRELRSPKKVSHRKKKETDEIPKTSEMNVYTQHGDTSLKMSSHQEMSETSLNTPSQISKTSVIPHNKETDRERISLSRQKKKKRRNSQASFQTDKVSKHSETSIENQDKDQRIKRWDLESQDDALFKSFETIFQSESEETIPKNVSHRNDDLEQSDALSKASKTSSKNENAEKDSWKIVSHRKKKTFHLDQIREPLDLSRGNGDKSARKMSRHKNKKLDLEQNDELSQTSKTSFKPKSRQKDSTDTVSHRKKNKLNMGQNLESWTSSDSSFKSSREVQSFREQGSLKRKAQRNDLPLSTSDEESERQKPKKKKESTTDNTPLPNNLEQDIFLCYTMPLDPDSQDIESEHNDNSQDGLQDEFVEKRDLREINNLNNEDCEANQQEDMHNFQTSSFNADSSLDYSLVDCPCSEQTSKLNEKTKECCYFGSDDEGCTTPKKKKVERCCEIRPPSKKNQCVTNTKSRERLSKSCRDKRQCTPPDKNCNKKQCNKKQCTPPDKDGNKKPGTPPTKSRSTEVDPDLQDREPFNPDDPNKFPCKYVPGFLKRKR
uniref:Uncharacterized protein n=1 Tax=Cacopsylla melanoneura TaxID=428564 RepID=A0A8D9FCK5_9HEMI